jgi:hypothetical protein
MRVTKRGILFGVMAVLAVGSVALSVQYRTQLAHAFKLATTHQPERFTELYFADPARLPKHLLPDESADVSFVIGNHQAQSTDYRYQVDFIKDGQTVASRTGEVTVDDSQTAVQTITIPPQPEEGSLLMLIRLPDQNQTIHLRSEISL